MSRSLLFLLCFAGLTVTTSAQTVSSTRIFADTTAGVKFWVDGQPYREPQTFFWTAGSKHTLYIELEQEMITGERYKFTSWVDSTGTLNSSQESITITADPIVTFYKAGFQAQYRLRVIFYQCGGPATSCRPPGTVSVGGQIADQDVEQWLGAGSTVVLQAFPNAGFVFNGWGPPSNNNQSSIYTHTMRGQVTFSAIFAAGKRVILLTDPEGLLVSPDRAPQKAPAELDWGLNTKHVLAVASPQQNPFNLAEYWVFHSWSNGARNLDTYTVTNTNVNETITAKFVRGAQVSFVTNPVGLKLKLDGRDNWPSYNFIWGQGMTYQVSAPPDQLDSRGRRYVFKGWSNSGAANQDVTINENDVARGFRLVATYEAQNRLTISTNPPGMPVLVNGEECRLNCVYDRSPGDQLQIAAAPSVPLSDTSRLEFAGWSDVAAARRTFSFADGDATLVANYRNFYRLTATADPGNGATFRVDPVSPDNFYETETLVTLTAEAKPGYRFRRWEGDLSGSFRSGNVTMNVPRLVRAIFEVAPYADEAGVRNAAGETPEPTVAPGSVAAIIGANLAGSAENGPLSPLAQTIGKVTVRLDSRYFPLLSIAPEQINLVVPSDLADGDYPVSVKWDSYPEVSTRMRVARNAPGLFQRKLSDKLFASAARENGDSITPDAPAQRGDTVTLYGTGFGPYDRRPPEGFPLPSSPQYKLQDNIEVLIGDTPAEVEFAGGAPGQVGVAMVRFKLPQDLTPSDGTVSVQVRVTYRDIGHESNRVYLPVQ